jgi:ubiquinone/menaquinone biosynthesis C-methylase UbiE
MQQDQETFNRWTGSAFYWEKHREVIRQMFAPISESLVAEAQIAQGQTVLDIATGPGEPALSVAALVGPEGRVWGIDPIPEMVAAARRAAGRLELKNVQFETAFADQLPFAADTFDAVISRFGVMFFPSPVNGIREMLRVLKPGRRLALAVWHFAERNPFHTVLARVMDQFVESPPLVEDAPDAFRFAERGKLLRIFAEAGVAAPSERLLQCKIEATVGLEDFLTLRLEMSEKLRQKFSQLSKEQVAEVRRLALASLGEFATERGLSFPAEILIVSGKKSRLP